MIEQVVFLLSNAVIWSILITAFFCYGLLLELTFFMRPSESWFNRCDYWVGSIRTMLAALPLLGLLGTISGLLTTFAKMSSGRNFALQEVISGGIAEALFTTQLGLLMVVPAILILAHLTKKRKEWLVDQDHEIYH